MKRYLVTTGIAMAMLSAPAAAQLDFDGHFYVQGFGGANWVDDVDFVGDAGQRATAEYDVGYGVGGAIGYDMGQFRFEGELAYRENDMDGFVIHHPDRVLGGIDREAPVAQAAVDASDRFDGDISAFTIMANVYYDIETGSAFTPYVGAGIGAGLVDFSISGPDGTASGDEWGFAAQGIAGAGYRVSERVELFAEGRILGVFDVTPSGSFDGEPISMDDDYVSYGAFAGVRFHFSSPEPAQAPAPQPAPEPVAAVQTEFMVFFDWDESVLTPQANNTLDQVVVVYDANGFARVNLAGHADRSGPASYNVGLSERRAESVRQGLVARGVAPDEIVVRAFGESQPLVPTPDGVREPQNRRVEIVLL